MKPLTTSFLLVCLILIKDSSAQLRCYSCNSYNNGTMCMDPMDPRVPTIICPLNYICSKVSYTIPYLNQRMFITSRSCDPSGNTCNNIQGSLQNAYPGLSGFRCSTCSRDYCNSGQRIKALGALVVCVIGGLVAKFG